MFSVDYTNGILIITTTLFGDSIKRTVMIDEQDHDIYFMQCNEDGTRTAHLSLYLSPDTHTISTPFGSTILNVEYDDVYCVTSGTLPQSPCVYFQKPKAGEAFDPRKMNTEIPDYKGGKAERLYVVTVTNSEDFLSPGPVITGDEEVFPFVVEHGSCSVVTRTKNIQFRVDAGSLKIISDPLQYDTITERDMIIGKAPDSLISQIRTFDWKISHVYRYLHGIEQFIVSPGSIKVIFHLPNVGVVEEKPSHITVEMKKKEGWSYLIDGKKEESQRVTVGIGSQKKVVMVHDETGVQADNINVVYPVKKTKPQVKPLSEKTQLISCSLILISVLVLAVAAA